MQRRESLRCHEAALPRVRQRPCGIGGVDLAGEPVAVEDAVGDQAGRDAVADRIDASSGPGSARSSR